MAKHKRNRKFTVTRQRATLRAEREQAMPKCTRCGGVGGHHAAGCPIRAATSEGTALAVELLRATSGDLPAPILGQPRPAEQGGG